MRAFSRLSILLTALVATGATAQLAVPQVVRLPTDDFVWNWGGPAIAFEKGIRKPHFSINGVEMAFRCKLTGAFRLGSRMRDFDNLRDFEQTLLGTIYFIQDATYMLNDLYRATELDWAELDCEIPETQDNDEKAQQRLDRALERAQRDRERRRENEESSDD